MGRVAAKNTTLKADGSLDIKVEAIYFTLQMNK
jgi:hypothetical protein